MRPEIEPEPEPEQEQEPEAEVRIEIGGVTAMISMIGACRKQKAMPVIEGEVVGISTIKVKA